MRLASECVGWPQVCDLLCSVLVVLRVACDSDGRAAADDEVGVLQQAHAVHAHLTNDQRAWASAEVRITRQGQPARGACVVARRGLDVGVRFVEGDAA